MVPSLQEIKFLKKRITVKDSNGKPAKVTVFL